MKKLKENRIEKIRVVRQFDNDADTSHIGTFNDHAKSDFAINHYERTKKNNVFVWFNAASVENCAGEPAADIKKYAEQDYERMVSLDRGDWSFLGIKAEAVVYIHGVRQVLSSSGLWGIESDNLETELRDIEIDQLFELREVLKAVGLEDDYKKIQESKIERVEK